MADQFEQLLDRHIQFIQKQHMFFVGTAAAQGFVNVSPKGMDSLRVLDSTMVWAEKKGKAGVQRYWEEKNSLSLNGLETDILS